MPSSGPKTSDICIIGGGPAGLAAALALNQAGREVTLLDCAAPPIDKACGEGLMPGSVAALVEMGVPLGDLGSPLRGIRFFGAQSSVSADFPAGPGRGLRRVALHRLMMERAERMGIRILWGLKNVHTRRGHVSFDGGEIRTGLIVGADGQRSSVRHDAGLDSVVSERRRYGFRKHFDLPPWSAYVEVYWGAGFEVYVTPVEHDRVCVALLSGDPHLRLDAAIGLIPALKSRLHGADAVTSEKGSLSLSRRLRRVYSDGYVLLGDASGSVDAITGEGMCVAFQQAQAVVNALNEGDLRAYQRKHRDICAKPSRMAALLLMLDRHPGLQRIALAVLERNPGIFRSLLALHVGARPAAVYGAVFA